MILVKFWLHISDAEQLAIQEAREGPAQALEADGRGLAQREKRHAYERGGGHARPHRPRAARCWCSSSRRDRALRAREDRRDGRPRDTRIAASAACAAGHRRRARLTPRPGSGAEGVQHVGQVLAGLARVGAVAQALVDHLLAQVRLPRASPGTRSITSITRWKRSMSLSMTMSKGVVVAVLLAAHVDVAVVRAPVGQAVDEPGVAVVGEDDRPVGREERVELGVGQAVRCSVSGCRRMRSTMFTSRTRRSGTLAQERHRRQRLERRHVARARQNHVGLAAVVVARPRRPCRGCSGRSPRRPSGSSARAAFRPRSR